VVADFTMNEACVRAIALPRCNGLQGCARAMDLLHRQVRTVFEIGGETSRYIQLKPDPTRGTLNIVDYSTNGACAAGTGSFLEERAEELGVSIKDEFAQLALSSRAPLRLGERCTVFMERDVNTYMQRGAKRADVIAGLAYSVVYNYINRVVRGRRIGASIWPACGTCSPKAT
jgi:activator of 2-hydroxyglutaryl-CoA dehydratase